MTPYVPPDTSTVPTWASGRFEVRRLLGKSAATMVWLVFDRRRGSEMMLTMPRTRPQGPAALARWIERARGVSRLDHANLTPVAEVGVHEHWPFVAVDRSHGVTLREWFADHPDPLLPEAAGWFCDVLDGLAHAHESGVAHGDLQLHSLLVNKRGTVRAMALGAALAPSDSEASRPTTQRGMAMDPAALQERRLAAERDVLACGVMLQHVLSGVEPLGLADVGEVIERLAPRGDAVLRLPDSTPLQIPPVLRAVADRATSGQERQRYRAARTLLGALSAWIVAHARASGGPVALMFERIQSAGHLPAMTGLAQRVGKIVALEGRRTDEIAAQILPDMAFSFELLRRLNTAQVQITQISDNGPVLTLRRVIELIGVDGVREAAEMLRPWPGALDDESARRLKRTMERVRLAGHVAQALRPAGYDPEVVFLVTALQNLGRLLVRYHFAEEAEQIEQLMRPDTAPLAADGSQPDAMTEEAAALSVLGVEVSAFGFAIARRWGIGEDVLQMVKRLPPSAPVNTPDDDAQVLQLVASAANEAVDAVALLPVNRVAQGLDRVVKRYGRILRISARSLNNALQEARDRVRGVAVSPVSRPAAEPTAPAELTD